MQSYDLFQQADDPHAPWKPLGGGVTTKEEEDSEGGHRAVTPGGWVVLVSYRI